MKRRIKDEKVEARLKDSEERIAELEELYILTRNAFLEDFDDLKAFEKDKYLKQLRGLLDDIAKEAGGRVKRQEIQQTVTRDSSFMELIAGIRGNLPRPAPVIEVMPVEVENAEEESTAL